MADKLDIMLLEQRKEYAKKARRHWEGDWWRNIAFVNGEQYVEWDDQSGRLVELVSEPGMERTIHNICMPITRRERAKILKTLPIVEALPRTESQDDARVAQVVNAQFRHWRKEWKLDRRIRNASFWIVTTGNVWLKWYWDAGAKDASLAVVPPFDVYPDPYAKSMMDCRWLIQSQFLDIEAAQEKYGKKTIQPSKTEALSGVEGRLYANYTDGLDANLPGVVVNEYWEPPSGARPDGAYAVFSGGEVLHQGKFPYAHNHMPFTHIGHIERANSKWYASVMDYMRGPQMELNRVESQILENRNLANGKWFIPFSLELEADPDASPRQVLRASGGPPDAAPQFIEIQALPAWVANEAGRIKDFAQDIAGQHEVSQGGVPGRVEAAQAIQLLQETDDEVLKDTIHSLEEALAEGHYQCAQLLRQFGSPDQMLKTYDRDGLVEIHEFKAKDIPEGDALQVTTQTTTGLPQSIAGRWDRVLNLWQYKVIENPKQVLELLNLAPESPDLLPEIEDKKQAYRENKLMAGVLDGQHRPVEPKAWNNHLVHIEEHRRYMNTEEYMGLPPETQQYIQFHYEQHQELQMGEVQKEAQLQMAAQGQPPPPPGGPMPPEGGPSTAPMPPQENGSPAPVQG
jgi:hypothetical protein